MVMIYSRVYVLRYELVAMFGIHRVNNSGIITKNNFSQFEN